MSRPDESLRAGASSDVPSEDRPERERRAFFSRRALLQAGWSIPIAVSLAAPLAMAQGLGHGDAGRGGGSEGPVHGDWGHVDEVNHGDGAHGDLSGHTDTPNHIDQNHTDEGHDDHLSGFDGSHYDSNHADGPHTDVTTHIDGITHLDHTHSDHIDHDDHGHIDVTE